MKHYDDFSTIKQKAGYLLLLAVSLGPWKTSLITNNSDTHALLRGHLPLLCL